ncbi:uncharacterized protein LOC124635681 [Helicoverpa zea]|uniref:uncharacterized protein LOC124635681 n=1 Tax=Helicoverpa zea TaxID=7113 RepID=UPI001F585D75|nr:uncharacterized protein LOC124635681 [Helicoverpa zea]
MRNGNVKTISNVYFVPNLTANLLSVSEMVRKGFKVVFSTSTCQIYDGEVVVASATLCDGVYQLDVVESTPIRCSLVEKSTETESGVTSSSDVTNTTEKALVTQQCSTASQEVWHRRLGHLNHRSMQLLNKELFEGKWYPSSNNHTLLPTAEWHCRAGEQEHTRESSLHVTRCWPWKEILG